MKNFLILVFFLVASVSFATAQTINDYIQSVDLIDMGEYELSQCSEFCYFDGAVYYVTFDEEDEIKQRYTLVKKTPTSTETTEFYLRFHLINNRGFKKIAVDSNFVILEDQFITYYLQRTPEGLKDMLFTSHKESAEDIKIFENKIYRSHSSIQGNSLWEKNQTWIEVFDLEKETHQIYDFPNPLGIEYMYFQPRKLIDFTKDNIYVMDVLDYKIKIYNYEGKLIDSIYKPFKDNKIIPTPNNAISKNLLHRFDISFTEKVQKHSKIFEENERNARIMKKIDFLNENTILICYSEPNEKKTWPTLVFDVWKFDTKKKKWAVVKEGLKMEPYNLEEREGNFDIKRLSLSWKYDLYNNNTLVTQNRYSYDILKLKTYKTWKEFHSLSEDFLKKSEVPNTIFIYKLQF